MGQNTSSAVMQQRSEPHDSLEDFPTPPWATRAVCEWIRQHAALGTSCREPAANRGFMVRPLDEVFPLVLASDIFDYGCGFEQFDFLFDPHLEQVDWTITNPPFRLADQFIRRALETSSLGVAVFVRSAFAEGMTRYRELFSVMPPSDILQFSERVVLHKGRLVDPDVKEKVWSKKKQKYVWRLPSTATAYCWMIWRKDASQADTRFHWIAPCRSLLTCEGDYDVG